MRGGVKKAEKRLREWDYTQQARYYSARPNYLEGAINELFKYVKPKKDPKYIVADVGAGTGNLTLMLLQRGLRCIAIEPNRAMMEIGKERTRDMKVQWIAGTGENTTLPSSSVDWFTMGSSFNTTDRLLTLKEAHRVLKAGGQFTCMWNHRDIENDPIQKRVEEIIESIVPGYERGVRREGQTDFILSGRLFNDVHYIEVTAPIQRTMDQYLDAWKSVRNKFWDLETPQGRKKLGRILEAIQQEFGSFKVLSLIYTTKIWTARRV